MFLRTNPRMLRLAFPNISRARNLFRIRIFAFERYGGNVDYSQCWDGSIYTDNYHAVISNHAEIRRPRPAHRGLQGRNPMAASKGQDMRPRCPCASGRIPDPRG